MSSPATAHRFPARSVCPAYFEALNLFGVSPADYSWTETAQKVFDHKRKGGHSKGGGQKAWHYPDDKNLPKFRCKYMSQKEYTAVRKYLKKKEII